MSALTSPTILSSPQLTAFERVAQLRSFSVAAQELFLTQSALSQRILNLEASLQQSLFVREPSGIHLTEAGERLLQYCRAQNFLAGECLHDISHQNTHEISGHLRIGGYSTIVRSLLIPAFANLCREHPHAHIDFLTREIHELPALLRSGQADFIYLNYPLEKQNVENRRMGEEKYVLIESARQKSRSGVYLDHDENDPTTFQFWKLQKNSTQSYSRIYFDEIYAIIQGVEEGLGRAVVPLHLIKGHPGVKTVKGLQPLVMPIYLVYFKQSFYSKLQQELIEHVSLERMLLKKLP